MKICLISNLFPPYNRGGAEQVVLNTLYGLKDRGHEVFIITARPWGGTGQGNETERIYRFFPLNLFFYGHDYKYPRLVRFFWHVFDTFNLQSFFLVKRILRREKPDLVHTHNLKGLGYLIPLAIRSLKLRQVHTLHDVQLVNPSGIIIKGAERRPGLAGLFLAAYSEICRKLFGSPEVVISPSKFLLSFYEERGFFPGSQKVVIPNPVIESAPVNQNLQPAPYRAVGSGAGSEIYNPQSFTFLYLGQIEEHKGVLFLIAIFKNLSAQLGDAKLYIVGAGSKLPEAQRMARGFNQIIFRGKVERASLPEIFSQADLTIVPSLCYENSPTVIFESFSYGVPVLASDIEGVAEVIKDGVHGFTFLTGEARDLAAKLLFCLDNIDKIRGMRGAARASVEGLGLEPYLTKLLELYTASA